MNSFDPSELYDRYRKDKMLEEIARRFLPNTHAEDLQEQSLRTDIDYKRRMMGMPLNDDDYEQAVNDNFDFPQPATNMLGYYGKKVSDRLPSLRHFEGSIGVPIIKGLRYGASGGGAIGRIAKFFGRG